MFPPTTTTGSSPVTSTVSSSGGRRRRIRGLGAVVAWGALSAAAAQVSASDLEVSVRDHKDRPAADAVVVAFLSGAERRGPGRHADPVDVDQRVHDLLGHAFAEILLVFRRAHIDEWNHGDGSRVRGILVFHIGSDAPGLDA